MRAVHVHFLYVDSTVLIILVSDNYSGRVKQICAVTEQNGPGWIDSDNPGVSRIGNQTIIGGRVHRNCLRIVKSCNFGLFVSIAVETDNTLSERFVDVSASHDDSCAGMDLNDIVRRPPQSSERKPDA